MYSASDFERFYIRYMAEALPKGMSIQTFCSNNKVPYNLFYKWYTDTRHKVVPVSVSGAPPKEEAPTKVKEKPSESSSEHLSVHIMIDIRMSNGLRVMQRNLSYQELVRLVENLEVLC